MESGILLELTKKARAGNGHAMAQELLNSGKAWRKFEQIITAQGKKRIPSPAKYTAEVVSPKNGTVRAIANKTIANLARVAGAPQDVTAGLIIHKKIGDKVIKGSSLYTIYAGSPDRLKFAIDASKNSGYEIA